MWRQVFTILDKNIEFFFFNSFRIKEVIIQKWLTIVLVSCACCNKWLQTGWFAIHKYSLMALKTTGCLSILNALGKNYSLTLPSFWSLLEALVQWPYFSVCLCCHAISPVAVLSLCPHFPFIRHQWLDWGPTLIECDFILMWFYL